MNIPYIFNPLWWFTKMVPLPYPVDEKKEKPVWRMEFNENYQTIIHSSKHNRKEAEEECFKLFNIHAVIPNRTKLDADIIRISDAV